MDFVIEDQEFSHKFHVLNSLPNPVILGEDFLDDNDAVLDYSCQSLIIDNSTSPPGAPGLE